ncbi:MAG: hypothetical protein HLUCCA04_03465 [Oceanicaulis sp. HLUCCA04]|nr:MAG: hypothetical protein HLUCCA04_03465 [Oceanicaulis sp. HLUCCA04]
MTTDEVTNSVSLSSRSSGTRIEHFVHVTENGKRGKLGPFSRDEQHRVAQSECLRLDLPNRMFAPIG